MLNKIIESIIECKSLFYYGEYVENDGEVYDKLSDKFIESIKKLQAKNITCEYTLACEIKKILERTLIKMLGHRDIGEMVVATLDDLYIHAVRLEGRLTDNEYECYVKNVITTPVDNKELDGTVIGTPVAFEFDYEEDGETYKMYIPALVSIGKYQVE